MNHHQDKDEMDRLFPHIRNYQRLASRHGIRDIFQDNGGKILQLLLVTGLSILPGREGNDARDAEGREYELKTVNRKLTKSFSTHHHMNPVILTKYREVIWMFGVYDDIELDTIYQLNPKVLEPFFAKWEDQWHDRDGKDLNNPKIPLSFVESEGELVFRSTGNPSI
jgi:hypothetical protein